MIALQAVGVGNGYYCYGYGDARTGLGKLGCLAAGGLVCARSENAGTVKIGFVASAEASRSGPLALIIRLFACIWSLV